MAITMGPNLQKKKERKYFYSFSAKHVPSDVNLKNRLIENHL